MSARAIWKGTLVLGDQSVAVKLYSAVEDRTIRFHTLESATQMRIQQRMLSSDTGEEVPRERIRKGFEFERGKFVILNERELQALEPKPSREIELTRFVPSGAVEHVWYDRPYYLGPDDAAAAYFALVAALRKTRREGIARWIMRKRSYVGVLRVEGDYLMLMTLRPAEEVVAVEDLPAPAGRAADPKELRLAEQLVAALEEEFRPAAYHDDYRERVEKFIAAKAEGQAPKLQIVARKKPSESLGERLTESLKAIRAGKEGQRAKTA